MADNNTSRRSKIFLGERETSLFSRCVAKLIDCVVVLAVFLLGIEIWSPFGLFAAMLFCGAQDSLWMGQSIGKRIMGLRVIDDHHGLACSFGGSVLRNLPFIVLIPLLTYKVTWIFALFLGVPLLTLETFLIFALSSGVRLGDVLGNTLVVEFLDDGLATSQP